MVTAPKITVGQDAVRPLRSPLPTSVKQDAILLYICPVFILEGDPRIMVTAPRVGRIRRPPLVIRPKRRTTWMN